jgi:2-polyprenyl-3-methyl-5-hydroxy-6-metoxy-1,4-benzoquinol methylase
LADDAGDETLKPQANYMSSAPYCHICDCSFNPKAEYARQGAWTYLRCPNCRLVLLHPVPDEADLRSYYNHSYQVNFEKYHRDIRRRAAPLLRDLREQFPHRGRLLEVGCAYGGFLAEAQRDGWDVTGVELSEAAARHAREQSGLRVFSGSLESQINEIGQPFDVVVMLHVIEHIPEPIQLLEMCRILTKPNGLLLLKTPNVASLIARLSGSTWQWLSPPAHLWLYSPATVGRLLCKSGYQPRSYRSTQGDANNNLFSLLSAMGKRLLPRSSTESLARLRRGPAVRTLEGACEFFYYPFQLLLDPWLGRKLWQPDLYVVAGNPA